MTIALIVILSSVLSAAIVGAVAYLIINKFVENEQKKSLLELKKIQESEALKVVNPIRLQAYERLALFLERISQVYVSTEAWSRIKEAKEEMINLINSAAVSLPPDADPMSLAGAVFENSAKQNPLDTALEFLKEEIRKDF